MSFIIFIVSMVVSFLLGSSYGKTVVGVRVSRTTLAMYKNNKLDFMKFYRILMEDLDEAQRTELLKYVSQVYDYANSTEAEE